MKFLIFILTLMIVSCSDGIKETADKVEREACEMVNGKLECATEEVADDLKDAAAKAKDTVDDMNN